MARFGKNTCNGAITPLPHSVEINPRTCDEAPLSAHDHHNFRAIGGGIAYISSCTRPDLTFAVVWACSKPSQSIATSPCSRKRDCSYIDGTLRHRLAFSVGIPILASSMHASLDADWGGCKNTWRSTTGFVFAVNAVPIFWRSKQKSLAALSSAEAAYVAVSSCGKGVTVLLQLRYEVFHQQPWDSNLFISPTAVEVDSSSEIFMASNEQSSKRTKHIGIRYHHIRDLVARGIIYVWSR